MMSPSKGSVGKMPADFQIKELSATDIAAGLDGLSDVLIDCVEGGASVSFMWPMTRKKADTFWRHVREGVERGSHYLFVAESEGQGIVGTVMLIGAGTENQPQRADIGKMLVHRKARRRGIGRALMAAAEVKAREIGKNTLVLDTVSGGEGDHLYVAMGWTRLGEIPNYALYPDGRPCPTTIFYKTL